MSNINQNRRQFIKHSGTATAASWLSAPFLAQLASAAQADGGTGYKALVCVFMEGGNDACNTILPEVTDTASWQRYESVRSGIKHMDQARAKALIAASSTPTALAVGTSVYPLHGALTFISEQFRNKQATVVANVGNILAKEPTTGVLPTRADFDGSFKIYPAKLKSHNDQQAAWYSGRTNVESKGWGGRYVDNAALSDPTVSGSTPANFRSVVLGNNSIYGRGDVVSGFGMVPDIGVVPLLKQTQGAAPFGLLNLSDVLTVAQGQFTSQRANLLERDYANLVTKAVASGTYMKGLLSASTAANTMQPISDKDTLTKDLQIVAKMIMGNQVRGASGRQVFFVSMRSFDTHSGQANHDRLLTELNGALRQFFGAVAGGPPVLLFTASEFGRLLHQNGDGTDHGWGGHHFVLSNQKLASGGTVLGKLPQYGQNTLGQYSDLNVGADGTLIPSLSMRNYAAGLGSWLGVGSSTTDMALKDIFKDQLGTVLQPLVI